MCEDAPQGLDMADGTWCPVLRPANAWAAHCPGLGVRGAVDHLRREADRLCLSCTAAVSHSADIYLPISRGAPRCGPRQVARLDSSQGASLVHPAWR